MNVRIYKTSNDKGNLNSIGAPLDPLKPAENLRDGYSDLLMMIAPSPSG